MARCSRPITIKNPSTQVGTRHGVYVASSRYARDNIIRRSYETIVVPCGKCLACLKNKQSSMVVRCKREAEQKGSFAFMTLTYDDDHLPLARSLWRVSKETGEMEVFYKPEIFSTAIHPDTAYTDFFKSVEAGPTPRYHEFPLCIPDGEFEYLVRITPSVCRSDVRTWLKVSRIQYKRDFGESLPDFSYVAISEYGPRTCRPHYHLAFFGLQRKHLNYLLERWKYGKVKQVKMVSQVNADGSSGFLKASKYIGKYMSKGKFECDSVKECCAEKPRVCQSLNLGTKDLEPIRRQLLCFDMFGEYDPETLRFVNGECDGFGNCLARSQVDALVKEIPKRLVYRVDDKTILPMPRIIRDKIFKCVVNDDYQEQKEKGGNSQRKVSSSLWCMVTAALRDQHDVDDSRKFEEFCACHSEREIGENILEFAYWEDFCAEVEDAVMSEDYKRFYARSHF